MNIHAIILVLALWSNACLGSSLTSVISATDKSSINLMLQNAVSNAETAYYGAAGISASGELSSEANEAICEAVKTCDVNSVAEIAFASSALKLVPSCDFAFPPDATDTATKQLNDESNMKNLYYAVTFLSNQGQNVDVEAVMGLITAAVGSDNSVLASSRAILAASRIQDANLEPLINLIDIEDVAAQADEVDSKYLHFENDLETTATFVNAVYALSEITDSLSISGEQVTMFANYILRSKTSIGSAKEAFLVLSALGNVAGSKLLTIAKADLVSGRSLSEARPNVKISVVDVFSRPLTKLTVKADSVTRAADNEVIISNTPFNFVDSYELLLWKNQPKSGFYDVSVGVSSAGMKLFGVSDLEYRVKVTTTIAVEDVELGTREKDQADASLASVSFPDQAGDLSADNQQKIVMKFRVKDLTDGAYITPHQTFVRFLSKSTGQEVIFVAEPDKNGLYKFEVNLNTASKEQFNSASGHYSVHLIVGDASISNPIFWHFADVALKFGSDAEPETTAMDKLYEAKPEIQHMFRQPEPRPPAVLSQSFTVACILPIILAFVLWSKIGANVGNMKLNLKTIIFQLGVAGIFGLYVYGWIHLNMFTIIKYLVGIGSVTFVFGNAVLSDLANS